VGLAACQPQRSAAATPEGQKHCCHCCYCR
jgi:hypothetical protein